MGVKFGAGWLALTAVLAAGVAAGADRGVAVTYKAPPGGRGGLSGTVRIYDHSLAVVIGVDKYRNSNIPQLTGAVRDAKTVTEELKAQGFAVTVLLDERATRERIVELLGDELPNQVGPNDRVLIYFAGHGVSTGEGERALGYLVPVDGDRNRLRATGISMNELTAWFEDYRCKHVMYVADACYSGLALSTRGLGLSAELSDYLAQITKKPVRMVMTAGGAGQEANEYEGQGLFTRYFLEAIRGAADTNHDGIVTSDEIAAYVKPGVAETAMTRFRREQNPQVGRSGEGEFVFVTGTAETAAKPGAGSVPAVAQPTAPATPVSAMDRLKRLFGRSPSAPATVAPQGEVKGSDGAPMVLIPAGEFMMGSKEHNSGMPHRVSISAFYMDKYLVTFDLYDRFCEATGRAKPSDEGWGRGNRPVINVTWDDANAYAQHYGKRLPTEAEWEYACRAGSTGKWCFGDDESRLGEYAWYSPNSGNQTHPVGQKAANAWGLYDMHGNVWEWCSDWYDSGYYAVSPANNPQGPASGTYRAMRGGTYSNFYGGDGDDLRSGHREAGNPAVDSDTFGFRCASSVKGQ